MRLLTKRIGFPATPRTREGFTPSTRRHVPKRVLALQHFTPNSSSVTLPRRPHVALFIATFRSPFSRFLTLPRLHFHLIIFPLSTRQLWSCLLCLLVDTSPSLRFLEDRNCTDKAVSHTIRVRRGRQWPPSSVNPSGSLEHPDFRACLLRKTIRMVKNPARLDVSAALQATELTRPCSRS